MSPFTQKIITRLQHLASQHECAIVRPAARSEQLEALPDNEPFDEDPNDADYPLFREFIQGQVHLAFNSIQLKAFLEYKNYDIYTMSDRNGTQWHLVANTPNDPDFLLTTARIGEYYQQACTAYLPRNAAPCLVHTDPASAQFGHLEPLRDAIPAYFQRTGGNGELQEWQETARQADSDIEQNAKELASELAGMTIRIATDATN